MIYLSLFYEFFKIGLFSIGGGLATIPFLEALSRKTDWFSIQNLVTMIALSESSPGPLGVNMATVCGVQTAGIVGGLVATIGLICPALVIIVILSKILNRYRDSFYLNSFFYGLRPAVGIMIFVFLIRIMKLVIDFTPNIEKLVLCAVLFLCYLGLIIRFKMHPIFFICLSAVMGILLKI